MRNVYRVSVEKFESKFIDGSSAFDSLIFFKLSQYLKENTRTLVCKGTNYGNQWYRKWTAMYFVFG